MSFNVNNIAVWADEISSGLAKEVLLNADTLTGDLVSKKFGVIGDSTKLNSVSTTAYAMLATCATIANTGSTELSQTTMQHCGIEFPQFLCVDTLKSYWTDWDNERKFNGSESLGAFEDTILANILEADRIALDKLIWQSDNSASPYKTGMTGNNIICRGFLGTLNFYSASTAANIAKSAITKTNALAVVNTVLASIPEAVLNDCNLYMSPADFQNYVAAVVDEYKYNASLFDIKELSEFRHPTSLGLMIKKTNGLSGVASGTMIATPKSNIILGISAESDLGLDVWYERKDRGLWVNLKVKIGTGFVFPELAVLVK